MMGLMGYNVGKTMPCLPPMTGNGVYRNKHGDFGG